MLLGLKIVLCGGPLDGHVIKRASVLPDRLWFDPVVGSATYLSSNQPRPCYEVVPGSDGLRYQFAGVKVSA